jgi:hypothetical protein
VNIDPKNFPHIDLEEQSARPGVDGPRYVQLPNNSRLLGYTNTGQLVYPHSGESRVSFDHSDDTQLRDAISIVHG